MYLLCTIYHFKNKFSVSPEEWSKPGGGKFKLTETPNSWARRRSSWWRRGWRNRIYGSPTPCHAEADGSDAESSVREEKIQDEKEQHSSAQFIINIFCSYKEGCWTASALGEKEVPSRVGYVLRGPDIIFGISVGEEDAISGEDESIRGGWPAQESGQNPPRDATVRTCPLCENDKNNHRYVSFLRPNTFLDWLRPQSFVI